MARIALIRVIAARIGEFLKELGLTEGRSTGVPMILRVMGENGSPQPELDTDDSRSYFLIRLPVHPKARAVGPGTTPHVTPHVERLLRACEGELDREELQRRVGLTDRKYFRTHFLAPALASGVVEMTIPDKPRSRAQKYRLTAAGRAWVASLGADEGGAEE